jgi:hypothetical protein
LAIASVTQSADRSPQRRGCNGHRPTISGLPCLAIFLDHNHIWDDPLMTPDELAGKHSPGHEV